MKKKPIFLHSLFRTGSTYIWHKLRQNEKCLCYYEPCHHVLAEVQAQGLANALTKRYEAVHHPKLDRFYLHEYRNLLRPDQPGIPYFRKEFSFDLFCLQPDERCPELKEYIDYLIRGAGERIPVFKFNRTALRSGWFKAQFPEAVHLYVMRLARDQWQSSWALRQRTGYNNFLVMDLLTASINRRKPCFQALSALVPLLEYHHGAYQREEDFYRHALQVYSDQEKYLIFYYIWLKALLENLTYADFILDIKRLSSSQSYRNKVESFFQQKGGVQVDFADAQVSEYSQYALSEKEMKQSEAIVQKVVGDGLTSQQRRFLHAQHPEWASRLLADEEESAAAMKKSKMPKKGIAGTVEKLERLLCLYADESFALAVENKKLQQTLQKKEALLKSLREEISGKDAELRKSADALLQTQENLLQNEKEITQKEREIGQKDKWLERQNQNLAQVSFERETLLHSHRYRIGTAVLLPLHLLKNLFLAGKKSSAMFRRWRRQFSAPISGQARWENKINAYSELVADFGKHRSGWSYAVRLLGSLHNPRGVLLDSFIERTFCWHPHGIVPHRQPWIGFVHVPPNVPEWFHSRQSFANIAQTEAWQQSLPFCRGLFTLSKYLKNYLEQNVSVPVASLYFPTETPRLLWSWTKFQGNREKKLIQVGWWLRLLHAIHMLPKSDYKKVFLNVEHKTLTELMRTERAILLKQGVFRDSMYEAVEQRSFVSNLEYDKLLAENIVFCHLYDASASNTIIECIVRNTPILINPLAAVREYLGEEYPFYFNSLQEAVAKASDLDLVYRTHTYLQQLTLKRELSGEHFLKSFATSAIYCDLSIEDGGQTK